jgi:hypothetical protein
VPRDPRDWEAHEERQRRLCERLERAARSDGGLEVRRLVLRGRSIVQLLAFGERAGIELAGVAVHGRTEAERIVMQELAIPLLRAAPWSVLAVPPLVGARPRERWMTTPPGEAPGLDTLTTE